MEKYGGKAVLDFFEESLKPGSDRSISSIGTSLSANIKVKFLRKKITNPGPLQDIILKIQNTLKNTLGVESKRKTNHTKKKDKGSISLLKTKD